jgi:uncharacterized damage-inducible protein DinB
MDSYSPSNVSESDTALARHMTSYAAYNVWANKEFSNWLSDLPEDLAQKKMVSSFPTIRETLFHLYNAEHGWFSWVKTGEWQSADESWKELSTSDLWKKLVEKSEEILAYVEDWNDRDWQQVLKRSNGLEMTRAQVFHTVFNHATYHRGQCITMGRQLGLTDPPRTDYVYFISL